MTIGDKLRLLKRESGLRLVDISQRLPYTRNTFCAWMSGRRRPGLWACVDLAVLFGCTVDQLLDGVSRWTETRGDPLRDYKPRWTLADHDG
jgi:DNA-binding XRE family transcriptional regulator